MAGDRLVGCVGFDGVRRLVLGTAQLTRAYGIANLAEPNVRADALALVRLAAELGVGAFDTAPAYGTAEAIIGEIGGLIPVFTKLPVGTDPVLSIRKSLSLLRRSCVDVAFFHDPDELISDPSSADRVRRLLGEQVRLIGASVYTPAQFEACLPRVQAIQAPVSVADRRWASGGLLEKADARGIAVYARSVYLQGALLMAPSEMPPHLWQLRDTVTALRRLAAEYRCTVAELLVKYVRDLPGLSGVVLGAENLQQLRHNAAMMSGPPLPPEVRHMLDAVPVPPEKVVDPRFWPTRG